MVARYQSGSGTVAAVLGHPLHPMVVPLPIGALVGAFVADLIFLATDNSFWAEAAFWLIAAGLVTGAAAALLGIIEMMGLRRARTMGLAWLHGMLNILALGISGISCLMRQSDMEGVAGGIGGYMTGAVVLLLAVSGWAGGEMAYRHGLGVGTNVGAPGEATDHERTPSQRPDDGLA